MISAQETARLLGLRLSVSLGTDVLAPLQSFGETLTAYGLRDETTLREFDRCAPAFYEAGLSHESVGLARLACSSGVPANWNAGLEGATTDGEEGRELILAEMRSLEQNPDKPGLLLVTPASDAPRFDKNLVGSFQERLFGTPGVAHRPVVFMDLEFAAGPYRQSFGPRFALFTPEYLRVNPGLRESFSKPRCIVFLNVVAERIARTTLDPAGVRFSFLDSERLLCVEDPVLLRAAAATWINLHEVLHRAGPMPYHADGGVKKRLGLRYAFLEELRVDMTAWLSLRRFPHLLNARLASATAELILVDRLVRPFFGPRSRFTSTLNASTGGLLHQLLRSWGALDLDQSNGVGVLDLEHCEAAIQHFLSELYALEDEAAGAVPERASHLLSDLAELLVGRASGRGTSSAVKLVTLLDEEMGLRRCESTTRLFFDSRQTS